MYVFVDESGSFTAAQQLGAWCTIAAYVCPETDLTHVTRLVRKLRNQFGGTEVKLRDLNEDAYFEFLQKLSLRRGIAFCVASDLGMNSTNGIRQHQSVQADKAIEHIEKMLHESGRQSLQRLSHDLRGLPPQLYAQLVFQVQLFHEVLFAAPLYFAQRQPLTLQALRWRIDRKDVFPTAYENVFLRCLPPLLQSSSLQDPAPTLIDGADYSHFRRFEFEQGRYPTYLQTVYGLNQGNHGLDVGKMIREDFQLVDSDEHEGVQVADLLAGGVRRLLRGGFKDNTTAARLLGTMFVKVPRRLNCIRLFSLDQVGPVSNDAAQAINFADKRARSMLKD